VLAAVAALGPTRRPQTGHPRARMPTGWRATAKPPRVLGRSLPPARGAS